MMKGQHLQVTYLRHFLEHDPPNFDHGHRLILDLEQVAGSRLQGPAFRRGSPKSLPSIPFPFEDSSLKLSRRR